MDYAVYNKKNLEHKEDLNSNYTSYCQKYGQPLEIYPEVNAARWKDSVVYFNSDGTVKEILEPEDATGIGNGTLPQTPQMSVMTRLEN